MVQGPIHQSALHSRTLSDELRVKSRFKSRSIGISMDPRAAVLMAGHTATGAYWLDPENASWITSSYYMDSLPGWVRDFNKKNYRDIYLERTWETLLPIAEYSESACWTTIPMKPGSRDRLPFPTI